MTSVRRSGVAIDCGMLATKTRKPSPQTSAAVPSTASSTPRRHGRRSRRFEKVSGIARSLRPFARAQGIRRRLRSTVRRAAISAMSAVASGRAAR